MEKTLTPDIFSCECIIKIKLSIDNFIDQNGHRRNWVWLLYFVSGSQWSCVENFKQKVQDKTYTPRLESESV